MTALAHDRRLVVFDMDGTLLPGTTAAQEISREAGVLQDIQDLEEQYYQDKLNSFEFSKRALSLWNAAGPSVFQTAWQGSPKLKNIRSTIATLKKKGVTTMLVTMAPLEFARNFDAIDHIYGSRYGEEIINPEDKPQIVMALAKAQGIPLEKVIAFGDSHSDIPLFRIVENTVAVNGTKEIQEIAKYSYDGPDLMAATKLVFPKWF